MLIHSQRHRPEDLSLWRELEEADRFEGERLKDKEDQACMAIRDFLQRPAYCGVSWGKDSVVVAHLCYRVDRTIPLLHLRPSNHNPDCDMVRDAYFAAFPEQPYLEVPVDYGDLHARNLPAHELDWLTDQRWYATIRGAGKLWCGRHILGIRSEESGGRRMREKCWGVASPNSCAPITYWTTAQVFAYLAWRCLPVHPAYAMLGGGRWPRERLRVAEIGDTHGTGGGRAEWEREYYGDVVRRLHAARGSRSST